MIIINSFGVAYSIIINYLLNYKKKNVRGTSVCFVYSLMLVHMYIPRVLELENGKSSYRYNELIELMIIGEVFPF